jgi:hypothetical protein
MSLIFAELFYPVCAVSITEHFKEIRKPSGPGLLPTMS